MKKYLTFSLKSVNLFLNLIYLETTASFISTYINFINVLMYKNANILQ